jgi:hypothetical protein
LNGEWHLHNGQRYTFQTNHKIVKKIQQYHANDMQYNADIAYSKHDHNASI